MEVDPLSKDYQTTMSELAVPEQYRAAASVEAGTSFLTLISSAFRANRTSLLA